MKYKLSICVVTMNRAQQLKEALESCLACVLPEKTEFVVIDNASTDNTEQVVKQLLMDSGIVFYYEKLRYNLGVGGGRNYAFSKARGTYMYILDDDAIIDTKNNCDFFITAVKLLDADERVVSLTTQIYDTAWGRNRIEHCGQKLADGTSRCKMFCGGSHFLRKGFFRDDPYLSNKYGYEELPPSLIIIDAGMKNVFCPDLRVIHKPKINKWDKKSTQNHALLIRECAIPYAIKKRMYPMFFIPILWMAFQLRVCKHLHDIPEGRHKCTVEVDKIYQEHSELKRIKNTTVLKMVYYFGFSVF